MQVGWFDLSGNGNVAYGLTGDGVVDDPTDTDSVGIGGVLELFEMRSDHN